MSHLRRLVTPADYTLDNALTELLGEPTYVLPHDVYACPGNPCSDPEEGAQAYNRFHSKPAAPERLGALLERSQGDIELCRLLVQIHDARDGNECLRLAIEAGEGGLFGLREEIQAMPSSIYLDLRNQVIRAASATARTGS